MRRIGLAVILALNLVLALAAEGAARGDSADRYSSTREAGLIDLLREIPSSIPGFAKLRAWHVRATVMSDWGRRIG